MAESLWDSYCLCCRIYSGKCQGERPLGQSRFVLHPGWPWDRSLSSQRPLRALQHHHFEPGQSYFFKLLSLSISNLDEQWIWFRVSRKADLQGHILTHKGQRKRQWNFSPSLTWTGERSMETSCHRHKTGQTIVCLSLGVPDSPGIISYVKHRTMCKIQLRAATQTKTCFL